MREFQKLLEHDESAPEEVEVSPTGILSFRLDFQCDECNNPDDVESYYYDFKSEIDAGYQSYLEKIRVILVQEGYIGK